MATATSSTPIETSKTDWRQEWFEIEDATYLNLAGQSPLPKISIRAVQASLEAKKFPHRQADSAFYDVPDRVRANLARLINAKLEEIALTTGATTGAIAIAHAMKWTPGDEVITGFREFPLQYTTWKPMEKREGIRLKVVSPRERFITAEDLIAGLTAKTRLVSVSMVRFDDGVLLDAARLARACHAQGALLLLDVSQCCGAMPLDVRQIGADFMICAGYKWLLGAFGTGFFWIKHELLTELRPDPFYWMAIGGSQNFAELNFADPQPQDSAKRWDTPEWASEFNCNLAALDSSLELVLRAGAEAVQTHNHKLIDLMFERLPKDRCVVASPLEHEHRGPYGCLQARSPEKTVALYEKLRAQKIVVSLREGAIRVSPYLYNSEADIDRLIAVVNS